MPVLYCPEGNDWIRTVSVLALGTRAGYEALGLFSTAIGTPLRNERADEHAYRSSLFFLNLKFSMPLVGCGG